MVMIMSLLKTSNVSSDETEQKETTDEQPIVDIPDKDDIAQEPQVTDSDAPRYYTIRLENTSHPRIPL